VTWWLALPYLAATVIVARMWSPLPVWVVDRVWPLAPAGQRPAAGDEIRG
jgi:hypothetical protein